MRLSLSITVPLCPGKNRYLPLMITVDTFDYTVFSISSWKMRSRISQSFFAKIRIPVMTFGSIIDPNYYATKATPPQGQDS